MTKDIIVEFDENSEEFKELWANYKEAIHPSADLESFAENIASIICRYGVREMIEGVGYVKHNGKSQRISHHGEYKEMESCINVEVDTDLNDMVDFEVDYTHDLSD